VLESSILFSRSVFSMLGEVLTPKILGSSTKHLIFFLSVDFPPTHANFPPGHALGILEPCQNILEPPTIHCQFAVHPFGTTTTTPQPKEKSGKMGKKT